MMRLLLEKGLSGMCVPRLALPRILVLLVAACLSLGGACPVRAGEHVAIVANLANARTPWAHVEVGLSERQLGWSIGFNVINAGGAQLAEFFVLTDERGFASSASAPPPFDNLFAVSQGAPV